ncbi:MAG: YbhB/YbcL family Raf kinase inhibitor-like protein [Actinomycetota bacterium]|nr:YbhB/YbcL family Raf kinase inhibitor-like protein [Actinomycetota bacterium]
MRRYGPILALAAVAMIGLAGCASGAQEEPMRSTGTATATLTLSSLAFGDRELMPRKYSCDGSDVSPPLSWSGVPEGTRTFALIVEDPDAGGFVHWVVAGIPAESQRLDEAAAGSDELIEGQNSFGRTGWGGPCPPSGEHRYVFTLYALSEEPPLKPGFDAAGLREAMNGKVLAQGELIGRYSRS